MATDGAVGEGQCSELEELRLITSLREHPLESPLNPFVPLADPPPSPRATNQAPSPQAAQLPAGMPTLSGVGSPAPSIQLPLKGGLTPSSCPVWCLPPAFLPILPPPISASSPQAVHSSLQDSLLLMLPASVHPLPALHTTPAPFGVFSLATTLMWGPQCPTLLRGFSTVSNFLLPKHTQKTLHAHGCLPGTWTPLLPVTHLQNQPSALSHTARPPCTLVTAPP